MPEEKLPVVTDDGMLTEFSPEELGAGFETLRLEEQSIPFLRIAQGLSPELNPGKGEYIPDLRLGMVFNTATRECYPGQPGLHAIICARDYGYGMWIPRDLGGGFRGMLTPEDALVRETMARMSQKYGSSARFKFPRYRDGKWSDEPARSRETGEAVELVETGQLYALYAVPPITAAKARRAVVGFTSTALGAYTSYVDKHLAQKWPQRNGPPAIPPIYAYCWAISTFQDKNAKGEFFNWRVDLATQGDYLKSLYARDNPELFEMAKEFFAQIRAGRVKADDSVGNPTESDRNVGNDPDDPPF